MSALLLCRDARKWHLSSCGVLELLPPTDREETRSWCWFGFPGFCSLPDLSLPTSVQCVQICVLHHSVKLCCPPSLHQHRVSQPHCFSLCFLEKLNRIVNKVPLGLYSGSFVVMSFGFLSCKENILKIWPLPILKWSQSMWNVLVAIAEESCSSYTFS